jgi:hypothetical protein
MAPTVTVAIPLHASAPWVDNVVENVRALPPSVTEIVVSDRTCVDDAASRLQALIADDPRVTVVADPVGLGWEDHFQLLLDEAAGELFTWMPHDDVFESSWVPTLVAALEANPEAWLAWGRIECVERDGVTPAGAWPDPRSGLIQGWDALRMMLHGEIGQPFRGVFRRQEVLDAGVRLRASDGFHGVDQLWVLAVALESALVHDPGTVTVKRFYPTSACATWGAERPGAHEQEALAVLREHGPGGLVGLAMRWRTRLAWLKGRLRPWLGPAWRRLRRAVRGRDAQELPPPLR